MHENIVHMISYCPDNNLLQGEERSANMGKYVNDC